jgi:hypothetical protein
MPPLFANYSAFYLRSESVFMTDPNTLRQPLTDLLQAIEAQDRERASSRTKELADDLDSSFTGADTRGMENRPAPVRFSGLCHALVRELRSAERHIASGNWGAAAKALTEAIHLLPEQQGFRRPNRPLPN